MSKIYVPAKSADDWKSLLAKPESQWATGYSARTLAHCWQSADGLPPEIKSMFTDHGSDAELLLAVPEHKVPLRGASYGESQSDVFTLVRVGDSTFAVTVEGKVNEPFGPTVGDWLVDASKGKLERLQYVCGLLDLPQPVPNQIYYQLLHRTASAVIEARRFKTDAAAMIVHSFSPEKLWFDAFAQFVSLFGATVSPNELVKVRPNAGPPLYLGWACGDSKFLTA